MSTYDSKSYAKLGDGYIMTLTKQELARLVKGIDPKINTKDLTIPQMRLYLSEHPHNVYKIMQDHEKEHQDRELVRLRSAIERFEASRGTTDEHEKMTIVVTNAIPAFNKDELAQLVQLIIQIQAKYNS